MAQSAKPSEEQHNAPALGRARLHRSNRSLVHLFLLTLLVAVGSISPAHAQDKASSEILSMEAAVAKAVRDNPSLAEMQSRFEALAEVPSQVGTRPDPMISLAAMNFPVDTFDRAQEPMTQLQLGFSQAFPFPGKLALKQEAAEHDVKAAGHSVDEARLQLVRKVKTRWWQLYYVDRALETVDRNQDLLGQFIKVAKTKYETGKGLQQDVLLAQLELSKLIDQRIQLEAIRRHQAIQLNILMDQTPELGITLPDDVGRKLPDLASETALYQKAETARPLLRQLETKVDAARSRLDLAKRDYYPDFTVGLAYGDRTGNNPMPMGGGRSDLLSVMLGVKVPIYAGRKQSKAVAQRGLEVQTSRYALLDERGLVRGAIATGVTDFQRAKQQLSLFETGIVPQAEQTVKSMLAGYQVSEVDFLNLVRSQMTLFNYELQYWKALSEAKQAIAQLEAAVGEETIYE